MKIAIKINGMYLKGFIYPRNGKENKRTIHLTRKPHYFRHSEIEGKFAVLMNIIACGEVDIDKFEVVIE